MTDNITGNRHTQEVFTIESLEALPTGTLIRNSEGAVFERTADGWVYPGVRVAYEAQELGPPVTVIWDPRMDDAE